MCNNVAGRSVLFGRETNPAVASWRLRQRRQQSRRRRRSSSNQQETKERRNERYEHVVRAYSPCTRTNDHRRNFNFANYCRLFIDS